MLTQDDLRNIGVELGKVIEQNVTPGLDSLHNRLDKVDNRLDKIESQMVTKSYLDDKLADLEGTVVVRQRKEDQKVNLLIDLLRRKSVLEKADVDQLQEFQVFPRS